MARWLVVLGVCGGLLAASPLLGQQSGPQRTILASRGASIVAQIRPSDEALTVVSTRSMPLFVLPPPDTPLVNWLTKVSSGVWLVRVSSTQGRLTNDADFVETMVSAIVLEALKDPPQFLVADGGTLAFVVDGGETTERGVRINGVLPWTRQPKAGQIYLLFGDVDPDTGRMLANPILYEQTPQGFVTLLHKAPPGMYQLGESVETTLRAVRLAGMQRPRP